MCGASFYHRKSARTYCSMACRNAMYAWRGQLHPGTFQSGQSPVGRLPVGAVTIRTRHKRGGDRRAWVKVAEPNVWRPRAVVVWETTNGPVPAGMIVHHEDRDTLNDDVSNLALTSRADHLREHRPEFEAARLHALASPNRSI
jgi:hypothetical protein